MKQVQTVMHQALVDLVVEALDQEVVLDQGDLQMQEILMGKEIIELKFGKVPQLRDINKVGLEFQAHNIQSCELGTNRNFSKI